MMNRLLEQNPKTRLQRQANAMGSVLTAFGWSIFGIAILFFVVESFLPPLLLEIAGVCLVPGWLLLRYSEGLFPFGRRLFP